MATRPFRREWRVWSNLSAQYQHVYRSGSSVDGALAAAFCVRLIWALPSLCVFAGLEWISKTARAPVSVEGIRRLKNQKFSAKLVTLHMGLHGGADYSDEHIVALPSASLSR